MQWRGILFSFFLHLYIHLQKLTGASFGIIKCTLSPLSLYVLKRDNSELGLRVVLFRSSKVEIIFL